MRAEAKYRLGDVAGAVTDINTVRARAYKNDPSGVITASQLNDKFFIGWAWPWILLWGSTPYRPGSLWQITNGNYNWAWKGGLLNGTNTDPKLNVFPIPADEISANSNIKQNTGY